MKVVAEETRFWLLLVDGGEHYLSVVCGTVAMYDLDLALGAGEVAAFRRGGRVAIEALARAVMDAPGADQARHLPDFHARPEVKEALAAWRAAARER